MTIEGDDWVRRVLGVELIPAGPTTETDDDDDDEDETIDVVAETAELKRLGVDPGSLWVTAVAGFRAATERVDAQIKELQAVLRATDDIVLHDIADKGLNALTGNTRVPLMAALSEAGQGDPAALAAARPKLTTAIANFRKQLGSDEIRVCDLGTFEVDMSIKDTYSAALDQLAYAMEMSG